MILLIIFSNTNTDNLSSVCYIHIIVGLHANGSGICCWNGRGIFEQYQGPGGVAETGEINLSMQMLGFWTISLFYMYIYCVFIGCYIIKVFFGPYGP